MKTTALARWLYVVAALIIAMIAIGGITRLTESGLSITRWDLVTGVVPPLNHAQWEAAFSAYKQIPQYTELRGPAGMTLAEFQFIYFWEWVHRLFGRLIGFAFAIPLVWFWVRKAIPHGYHSRLLIILALGALQGAVGWWMVTSGLGADAGDRVSPYRLAVHLLIALITLGAVIWTALDLRQASEGSPQARLAGFGALVLIALFIQLFFGAIVAGMHAGVVAGAGWFEWGAWPLMQGRLFPDGVNWAAGLVQAVFHDPYLVHFIHRWWAWLVVVVLIILARKVRSVARPASIAIHTAFGTQIILGIAVIWSSVSLWLAVAHQFTGALVVAATVWGVHELGRR